MTIYPPVDAVAHDIARDAIDSTTYLYEVDEDKLAKQIMIACKHAALYIEQTPTLARVEYTLMFGLSPANAKQCGEIWHDTSNVYMGVPMTPMEMLILVAERKA